MKKTRRAKITFETERSLVVIRRQSLERRCEFCGAEVEMIEIKTAAAIARTSQREIFRRVENGSLHFAETEAGNLLICLGSLLQNLDCEE